MGVARLLPVPDGLGAGQSDEQQRHDQQNGHDDGVGQAQVAREFHEGDDDQGRCQGADPPDEVETGQVGGELLPEHPDDHNVGPHVHPAHKGAQQEQACQQDREVGDAGDGQRAGGAAQQAKLQQAVGPNAVGQASHQERAQHEPGRLGDDQAAGVGHRDLNLGAQEGQRGADRCADHAQADKGKVVGGRGAEGVGRQAKACQHGRANGPETAPAGQGLQKVETTSWTAPVSADR